MRSRHAAKTAGALNALIAGMLSLSGGAAALGQSKDTAAVQADGDAGRPDLLTFASGAVPLRVGGAGATAKSPADMTQAVQIVDGNPAGFVIAGPLPDGATTEFVYALPALTTFERFAVPGVFETPSPSQTFIKDVKVYGSSTGPDAGFELLAQATLATHRTRGEVTELTLVSRRPVKWVKVDLAGGIKIERPQSFVEFSELIGNGTQEPVPLATNFTGVWKRGAADIELKQEGPMVTGCYDRNAQLTGWVSGNILRATGKDTAGVPSAFVLNVAPDGSLRGVRSSNNGPFRLYDPPIAPPGTTLRCTPRAEAQRVGCGSIVYGITFDFDSATIRADAEPVLNALFAGLDNNASATIVIEGHTSSEGSDQYNLQLSQRRAQAVVDALVQRGLAASRIRALGKGESEPIAKNDDEAGRALNRRVEIACS